MKKIPVFFAFLIACGSLQAADFPRGDRVSLAGFSLGEGTLFQVQEKLGATPFAREGEAGTYRGSVCYRVGNAQVGFLTNELGGPQRELLGFELSSAQNAACPALKEKLASPLAIGGLHLGMSRASFASMLGGSVKWNGDAATFEKLGGTTVEQKRFDLLVSVTGHFNHDVLARLEIWRLVTN
jgi:hypothetical protein